MDVKINVLLGDSLPDAMLELAKLMYQLCVKHGKEYIAASGLHGNGHESGFTTFEFDSESGLTNLWYSPEEDTT